MGLIDMCRGRGVGLTRWKNNWSGTGTAASAPRIQEQSARHSGHSEVRCDVFVMPGRLLASAHPSTTPRIAMTCPGVRLGGARTEAAPAIFDTVIHHDDVGLRPVLLKATI